MSWTHAICRACWAEQRGIWMPDPPVDPSMAEVLEAAWLGDLEALAQLSFAASTARWPGRPLHLIGVREPTTVRDTPSERCCFCGDVTNAGIFVRHDPAALGCTHD